MAASAARVQPFETTVERVVDETPTVRTLRLRLPPGQPFDFIPGQFLMLQAPGVPKPELAFSIASSPEDKGYAEVTVRSTADPTKKLFTIRSGDKVLVHGPYGKWHFDAGEPAAVLIAGGTGITPMRAIWRSVLDRKQPTKLTLLYSAREPDEVVYAAELAALGKAPGMKVYTTITRAAESHGWKGNVGRIDLKVIRREVADLEKAMYYLCGTGTMVRELTEQLAGAGVPRERIRYEKWGEF